MDTLVSWVLGLLAANPHFAVLITFISVCRLVFKPLCAFITLLVNATGSTKLATLWQAIEDNKFFKAVAWLMDYFASIKLPATVSAPTATPVPSDTQPVVSAPVADSKPKA